eukprot:EC786382.1.p3 GENE.EC786382.1~~EC786382.1.p3  ORF type:complete len:87 (+),score=27.01 EC786382.1:121-381(+)
MLGEFPEVEVSHRSSVSARLMLADDSDASGVPSGSVTLHADTSIADLLSMVGDFVESAREANGLALTAQLKAQAEQNPFRPSTCGG